LPLPGSLILRKIVGSELAHLEFNVQFWGRERLKFRVFDVFEWYSVPLPGFFEWFRQRRLRVVRVTIPICTVAVAVLLALKLVESLAKLVGIILAVAVAITGRVTDRLKRES
jgi:hypothetical protein